MADRREEDCKNCKGCNTCGPKPESAPSGVTERSGVIDWTKPLQTWDGHPARLLGTHVNAYGFTHTVAVGGTHIGNTIIHERVYSVNINGNPSVIYPKNDCIENVPEKKVRARIWVRSDRQSSLVEDNIHQGTYRKKPGQTKEELAFYAEMTETEAKDRGLEYEVI